MRKSSLHRWLFLCALVLIFCSCTTKEGRFRPDKRLVAVYEQSYTLLNGDTLYVEPRSLVERLDWDGNTLNSITYYSGSSVVMQEVFSYDSKHRVITASLSGDYTTLYHYNGDQMDSITLLNAQGKYVSSVAFTHGRSRIKTVTYNNCATGAAYKLSWDGDNVAKMVSEDESQAPSREYSYDNKKNPYQGLFCWWMIEHNDDLMSVICPNNWLRSSDVSYSYSYASEYPVERTRVEEYDYVEYVWNTATQVYDEVWNHRYQKVTRTYEYED